jgi:hypothetical protein
VNLGHIKETMTVQLISFACLVLLLMEFNTDFVFNKGLNFSINWFGEGQYSQLVGVILFNYAFAITVPSWLAEKTPETPINRTIWTASIFSSLLYISFGMLSAFAFEECSESMLTLLASNEVSFPTRISAALFGLTIVGAGTPIFCVIIKNTLYSTKTCNAHWSFFIGSVFPYLTAWCLYKGTLLMDALNWTGLVVNGLAAFCFPLILCWWYFTGRSKVTAGAEPLPRAASGDDGGVELSKKYQYHYQSDFDVDMYPAKEEEEKCYAIESALPDCLIPYRTSLIAIVVVLFATAISSSIGIDIVLGQGPS